MIGSDQIMRHRHHKSPATKHSIPSIYDASQNLLFVGLVAALLIVTSCPHSYFDAVDAFAGLELLRHPTRQNLSRCRHGGIIILFQAKSNTIAPTEDKYVILNDSDSTDCKSTSIEEVRGVEDESVPSTWSHAFHRFFIREPGPPLVLLSISGFIFARIQSSLPYSTAELSIFASSIIVWWIQEYFFHRILLHSPCQWLGKSIHQTHHGKNYFHVSIDPPELLLGWLLCAHLILKSVLPWHYCLSATIGYALAGLVYEWSHYIVHTKVRPPPTGTDRTTSFFLSETFSRLFSQMRDNHMRHHLVDDRYWYSFSIPAMDDLFDTNPNVKEVRRLQGKMK